MALSQSAILSRIARFGGLNSHVLGTLLFRGWALLAGLFTMLLIPLCLPREHQGFYFTFSSLISLQIFFELGFNHVITQIVSHEASLMQLATEPERKLAHAAKLASVRRLSMRWYLIMAALFAPAVFFSGAYFFYSQQALPTGEWMVPWGLLCCASALNLYVSPQLAIAEGLQRVDRVARLRLVQSIGGYAVMWVLLMVQAKLWAAVAVPCVAAAMSLWWVRWHAFTDAPAALGDGIAIASADLEVSWRRDVLPLQWRIALSWVSGYFIFQMFNPFIFSHHGAVMAGRAGLALAAYTAIQGLGMSWMNATAPTMSAAIACGDRVRLKSTFSHVAARSLVFTAVATSLLIAGIWAARALNLPLADRIADTPTLIYMGIATLTNCAIAAMAIFMRCHKEEPMLANSLVTAVLIAGWVAVGSRMGVQPVFAFYAAITVLISLPWTFFIFCRYWRR